MKHFIAALAVIGLPAAACAQSPKPPQPPEVPDVSTVTEDCGENCTRTTTTIRTAESDENGNQTVSKSVKVIELRDGGDELADIDIEDGIRSSTKVKVITSADGEITPEMRDKINALIADIDGGEGYAFKQSGDGLVVVSKETGVKKTKVIIRDDEQEIVSTSGDVKVDQIENADGSRTIRIAPKDGSGETTVITIEKENSSESDN